MKILKNNRDDTLLNKIDDVSFRALFDQYWKRLVAFCQYHTNDDEVAMDIVQDIFCSIWKRKDSLRIETNMEHYLFRAARIKITDHYREKFKKENHNRCISENFCESINNTEETILHKDLDHYVDGLVNRLPCRCKQVYTLSRNSGLSIPEIAKQLVLSEKTVEAHLTKALRFLKTYLIQQPNEK